VDVGEHSTCHRHDQCRRQAQNASHAQCQWVVDLLRVVIRCSICLRHTKVGEQPGAKMIAKALSRRADAIAAFLKALFELAHAIADAVADVVWAGDRR